MCYKGYNHTEESKELNRDKHLGKTSLRKNKTFIFFDGGSKICSKCKEIKTIERFQKDKQKPSGFSSYCKDCRRESKIKKLYNISSDEYDNLYESQMGRCKICNNQHIRLHIDHCHVTGRVRGLLCSKCNMAIGLFNDNIEVLKETIKYISNND